MSSVVDDPLEQVTKALQKGVREATGKEPPKRNMVLCSFCGKSLHEVLKMVTSPFTGATICDECVSLAVETISKS